MGDLPPTIGSGEHEKPLMEGILVAMNHLHMDVQDLKGAVYHSWELDRGSFYVTQGMKFKEQYTADCRRVKGKGQVLGHQKNYVMMGMLVAMMEDKDLGAKEKEVLMKIVGSKVMTDDKWDVTKARNLNSMVSHCQVVRATKKGFVNILLRGAEGLQVFQLLEQCMDREGERQWGHSVPRPIAKGLKMVMQEARRAKQ